ncbi:DEAD/DEAH box helicase [Clostridium sp.]|uniref:DEAD/DEAH box helicase n=1 Tax=Clostridium sp. TaxID=1506 RepID=UPI001A468011|nr:DEAD/DEAH box helicase [Clostridium sp.]MBK5241916.1 hypothetical protein [Clostridium sp.]
MKTVQEKISKQMTYVKDQVINGENRDWFNVINMESGSGKSIAAQSALGALYKLYPDRKSLYVMKFKDTDKENNGLCTVQQRINECAGAKIAIAIDSDNFTRMKDKIKNFPVIIITHERYRRLSLNSTARKIFTEGRSNLIIDEEIDMLQTYEDSLFRINSFENILPHKAKLKEIYVECVKQIKEAMVKVKIKGEETSNKTKFISLIYDVDMKKKFKIIRELMDRSITNEHARQYQKNILTCKKNENQDMTKKDFMDEIELIKKFYMNVCYVNANSIYTYNNKIKYWRLENNILLDASGGFNHCYKIASHLFKCSNQSKIFDHSKWVIKVSYNNVTKTAINSYLNYDEELERLIGEITMNGRQMLIVTSKEYEEKLKEKYYKNIDINHFGNIIGKNTWRDYSQILIPLTYNLPEHVYILKYLYYSNNNIQISTEPRNPKGKMREFINSDLEKIRVSFIAGEIYQAIKRIDRNVTMNTEVFLICVDPKVVETVLKQLVNCKRDGFFFWVKRKEKQKKEYDTSTRRIECHTNNFIDLLSTIGVGKYQKKELRFKLGITKSPNFSRIFLDEAFIKFIDKNKINIGNRFIEIVQPVQI